MSNHEPDEKELAEAQALARALDGDATEGAPQDALEAAALLRYGARPDLEPARKAQILADLLPRVARRRRHLRWWLLPIIAVPAAVVLLFASSIRRPALVAERPAMRSLPATPLSLLHAQRKATEGRPELLDAEMQKFRKTLFVTLSGSEERP